jgi:hypothetical protein
MKPEQVSKVRAAAILERPEHPPACCPDFIVRAEPAVLGAERHVGAALLRERHAAGDAPRPLPIPISGWPAGGNARPRLR